MGMMLPLLENVPQFEYVRIHCGNTAKDTEGCILVGNKVPGEPRILDSRLTYARIFLAILPHIEQKDDLWITIL